MLIFVWEYDKDIYILFDNTRYNTSDMYEDLV